MSKHFYRYLATKIENYYKNVVLHPGDKYHIQFEREEQVTGLIEQLHGLQSVRPFEYETPSGAMYKAFCLQIADVDVVVASTKDGTKPDFLTTLRNKVGTDEVPFERSGILLVHDSNLDSLVHGMISFSKEGMPFHLNSIEKDMHARLHDSVLSDTEKRVLSFAIKMKNSEQTYQEQITLFDFQDILEVLSQGQITGENYAKFGMFHDKGLSQYAFDPKELEGRLKENYKLYETVEKIHKYGNPESDLDKHFDDKGVARLREEEIWKEVDFVDVKVSNQNKKSDVGLLYKEVSRGVNPEEVNYWECPDGDSKAKSRNRNILIFNPKGHEQVTLEFEFNDHLQGKYITINKNSSCRAEAVGKKLRIHVYHERGKTSFSKVSYKTDTSHKYEFRIASVECDEHWLSPFKTAYRIITKSDPHILILSEDNELVFNPEGEEKNEVELTGEATLDKFEAESHQQLVITKNIAEYQDDDLIRFNLAVDTTRIPFAIQEVFDQPAPISGFNVWKLKRERQAHFTYKFENDKLKIVQGTRESFAQGEFKRNLDRELSIVQFGNMFFHEYEDGLRPEEINIAPAVRQAYDELVQYFRDNHALPSLAHLDTEYKQLATNYVTTFLSELQKIEHGQSLDVQQRNLALVGSIERKTGDQEWLLTPLHPLNLAYQLQLQLEVEENTLGDELLKTMRAIHLLPYVRFSREKVYKPIEQTESPEWTVYVDQHLSRYEGNRTFINKLVLEKIEEFTQHFGYLFSLDRRAPLRINVINMGDCREVMQGIFEYYKKQLRKVAKAELLPIELHIYSELGSGNVFEEFSHFSDVREITERFDLKLQVEDFMQEEVLNVFRDKVRFYSQDVDQPKYEYCHIAFYQMRKIEETANSSMSEIMTGVSLQGLVSGVPSVFISGGYKTGFGTKHYPESSNLLLNLVPRLNTMLSVARTLDNYQADSSVVTAIAEDQRVKLDRVYDSSHWVTFVEPHVDLSFFKNDAAQKNLLVIHYSDQYTSSSGFDAITVTRKSAQYQQLIGEYLNSHKVESNPKTIPAIINFFNAVNGSWLLRMIAQQNHFPKEKISILSAVKLALSYFDHPEIIWVPISMEEVLRISGGTGLRQIDGLFSAKNLGQFGSYSDDLLLIGIEGRNGQLFVHLYPVEVKIGKNAGDVKEKGIEQVKKTRDLLRKFLQEDNTFQTKIYRNFFMQLAIMSAEKMKLYEIWPEQKWDLIIDNVNRKKLMNDDFQISGDLSSIIGLGAVISFKRDLIFSEATLLDDVYVIDYPESSGLDLIVKDIENLRQEFRGGNSDIPITNMLFKQYRTEAGQDTGVVQALESRHGSIREMGIAISQAAAAGRVSVPEKADLNGITGEPEQTVEPEQFDAPGHTAGPEQFVETERTFETVQTVETEQTAESVKKQSDRPMEILFGHHAQNGQPIKWYPTSTDKVMHTNTGIIGTMGTGKTQFTKSLIAQLNRNSGDNVGSTPIDILIFDYKGDYIKPDFVDATGAKVFDLYHLPFNPLALYVKEPAKPLLPVHTCNTLIDSISTAFNLGPVQSNVLRGTILDAYQQNGIDKGNRSTWSRQAPTISDVYNLYTSGEEVKVDSLYAALRDLYDYEVFEPDSEKTIPLFDMIQGITVINLSGYNESIQNLVVAITLDVFYNQMQMLGHSKIESSFREITRMILVDEADNFLSKEFNAVKKILKEGREFGVGTILSTQFMSHFSTKDNDYANYILTWIVHNVAELSAKDIRMIFNTQSRGEEENILSKIKSLDKHFSIVKGVGNQPVWMRDKAFWELTKELTEEGKE